MSFPQYHWPSFASPEGYGGAHITNEDHSITVLPGALRGLKNYDDGAAINAAFGKLPQVVATGGQQGAATATVGTVRLGPYPYNLITGIVKPASANLLGQGPGTQLNAAKAGITCLYTHSLVRPGQQFGNPAILTMGRIADMVIDGTLAGANAIGLDMGDGWGHTLDNVAIQNFTGSGAQGLYFNNAQFWSEKINLNHLTLSNNTTAATFDTTVSPADVSHEYNLIDICLFAQAGQQGLVLTNSVAGTGVNWGGVHLTYRGNMSSQSSLAIAQSLAFLTLLNGARLYQGTIKGKIEGNNGSGTPGGSNYPYFIFSDGNSYVKQSGGHICHSIGNSAFNSVLNGAEFSFHGGIAGDPDLAQSFSNGTNGTQTTQPAVPATTVAYPNYGPDMQVSVVANAGGTCAVAINNSGTVTIPAGQISTFFLNAGGSIKLTYTSAPTWEWQSACQMIN